MTESTVHPELAAHTEKMAQKIYRIGDNIYHAVGYGIANSTMVVGNDGIIIIDTMEDLETGKKVLADFRQISNKPIKAIVYTHNHIDHVCGAKAFASEEEVRSGKVDIYAHEKLLENVINTASIIGPVLGRRTSYFAGSFLEKGLEGFINLGIGPFLGIKTPTFIVPNKTFSETIDVEVAGIKMHLHYIPSETEDEICVWFPDLKVLNTAEAIQGECFPNLYTIRGTKYRDPKIWFKSIDVMRSFGAEVMVPTHGRPVEGADNVEELLRVYRDAIQYVHDQTIRLMNKGLTPDELVEAIPKLPPQISHPWLGEFYGTVKHSVRDIYRGKLGWFGGDPTYLDPIYPVERAHRYVELMGGRDKVLGAAQKAFDDKDYQWAAELLTYLIRIDHADTEARKLKAKALRQFGYQQISSTWRNFALTAALELEDRLPKASGVSFNAPDIVRALPASVIIESMTVRLDPEKSAKVHMTMGINLSDISESYGLEIRRGVCQFHQLLPQKTDVTLVTTKTVLDKIVLNETTFDRGLADGSISVDGNPKLVEQFFGYFDAPINASDIMLTIR